MPKRTSNNRPRDINRLAASIVQEAIDALSVLESPHEKNPAAVALGRMGGLKGGRVRADRLSPKKRSQIARKAAKARWAKAEQV